MSFLCLILFNQKLISHYNIFVFLLSNIAMHLLITAMKDLFKSHSSHMTIPGSRNNIKHYVALTIAFSVLTMLLHNCSPVVEYCFVLLNTVR